MFSTCIYNDFVQTQRSVFRLLCRVWWEMLLLWRSVRTNSMVGLWQVAPADHVDNLVVCRWIRASKYYGVLSRNRQIVPETAVYVAINRDRYFFMITFECTVEIEPIPGLWNSALPTFSPDLLSLNWPFLLYNIYTTFFATKTFITATVPNMPSAISPITQFQNFAITINIIVFLW